MTVSSSISRSGPYAGSGTVGPFSIGFRFLEDSHLSVVKTVTATGVETTLVLNVDYTVTGAGAALGGSLTLTAPLAVGSALTIQRDVPITQETDYVESDGFPAEAHEDALDKLTMIAQQLQNVLGRSIRVPELAGISEMPDAATRANKVIAFDSSGNPTIAVPSSGSAADVLMQLANAALSTQGDALVVVKRTEASAIARTLHFYIQHSKLKVASYCDPTSDTPSQVAAALANAITDTKSGGKVLEFDPGAVYITNAELAFGGAASAGPLRIWGNGAQIYRSSGAGPVVSIDSGGSLSIYDCELFDLRVRGNAASTYGLYTRGLQSSVVEKIRVVDVATAGFKVDWSVCTKFKDLLMSVNCDTFAVIAQKGLIVDRAAVGLYTAASTFENCKFEGSGAISDVGIELVYADLSNVFRGGTCEGMVRGFRALSTSGRNIITEMDFESNSDYDILIQGNGLTLKDVNASSAGATGTVIVDSTAQNTTFDGQFYRWVMVHDSSKGTRFKPGTKVSNAIGITNQSGGALAAGVAHLSGVVKVDGSLNYVGYYQDGFAGALTWTPGFASAGGGAQGAVTAAVGTHGLTGRLCHVQGFMSIAKGTLGAGAISVTGFPLPARNVANAYQYIPVAEWSNINLGAGYTHLTLRIAPGGQVGTLLKSGTSVASAVVNLADFPDPMVLNFAGSYEVG